MNENIDCKLPFEVPFIASFKLPIWMLMLYIFLSFFFLLTFLLLLNESIILSLLTLVFEFSFSYFVMMIFLKKFYVEITNEFIKVRYIFVNKTTYWNDVVGIGFLPNNNITYGVVTKEKLLRQQQFLTRLIDILFSHGPCALVIPLALLPHIDIDRLILTIENKIVIQDV